MTTHRYLPVGDIKRRADARPLNEARVAELAESIAETSDRQPFNPIVVRFLTDGYELLAGGHRLAAMQKLGEAEIICSEVDSDDLHAELIVIDENLIRSELSPAERAAQMDRRKTIYEELHPETRHGAAGNGREKVRQVGDSTAAERFTSNTASATGQSERSVQRDVERGEKIAPEALTAVKGTKLDKGVYLEELKRVPKAQQVEKVKRDLAAPKAKPPAPDPSPSISDEGARRNRIAKVMTAMDAILAETPKDIVASCEPRQRAALCQRASSLIDLLNDVLEGAS
jgi:hypothetical protein